MTPIYKLRTPWKTNLKLAKLSYFAEIWRKAVLLKCHLKIRKLNKPVILLEKRDLQTFKRLRQMCCYLSFFFFRLFQKKVWSKKTENFTEQVEKALHEKLRRIFFHSLSPILNFYSLSILSLSLSLSLYYLLSPPFTTFLLSNTYSLISLSLSLPLFYFLSVHFTHCFHSLIFSLTLSLPLSLWLSL